MLLLAATLGGVGGYLLGRGVQVIVEPMIRMDLAYERAKMHAKIDVERINPNRIMMTQVIGNVVNTWHSFDDRMTERMFEFGARVLGAVPSLLPGAGTAIGVVAGGYAGNCLFEEHYARELQERQDRIWERQELIREETARNNFLQSGEQNAVQALNSLTPEQQRARRAVYEG